MLSVVLCLHVSGASNASACPRNLAGSPPRGRRPRRSGADLRQLRPAAAAATASAAARSSSAMTLVITISAAAGFLAGSPAPVSPASRCSVCMETEYETYMRTRGGISNAQLSEEAAKAAWLARQSVPLWGSTAAGMSRADVENVVQRGILGLAPRTSRPSHTHQTGRPSHTLLSHLRRPYRNSRRPCRRLGLTGSRGLRGVSALSRGVQTLRRLLGGAARAAAHDGQPLVG